MKLRAEINTLETKKPKSFLKTKVLKKPKVPLKKIKSVDKFLYKFTKRQRKNI